MAQKKVEIVDSVVLDVCPKCDGIWMDRGELKRISKEDLIEFRMEEKGEGTRICPKCKGYMKRADLRGVILDECDCGIYFDKGEADRVLGKRLAMKAKDEIPSISVSPSQLKELIANKSIIVESHEIRLIRDKDEKAD